jgi:hypothetical protein
MRVFLAGLRKLVGRPASFVSVGLLVGLLGLILFASATIPPDEGGEGGNPRALVTFPGAYDLILSFMFGFGGLIAVIYGAAIAGSEWSWGTLKNAVARGESRSRYMLGTFAAIMVMLAVGLAITFVLGVAVALGGASIAGIPTAGVSDAETLQRLPALVGRGWFAVVEQAAIGFAIATLTRSQLAGIGVGIAFYFGETFARFFLPGSSSTCRSPSPRRQSTRAMAVRAGVAGSSRSWSRTSLSRSSPPGSWARFSSRPCSRSGPRSPAERDRELDGTRRRRRKAADCRGSRQWRDSEP